MKSYILKSLDNSFRSLPNSEKARIAENVVTGSLSKMDRLFSNFFSPEVKQNPKRLDRNNIKGLRSIYNDVLPPHVTYYEADDMLDF